MPDWWRRGCTQKLQVYTISREKNDQNNALKMHNIIILTVQCFNWGGETKQQIRWKGRTVKG